MLIKSSLYKIVAIIILFSLKINAQMITYEGQEILLSQSTSFVYINSLQQSFKPYTPYFIGESADSTELGLCYMEKVFLSQKDLHTFFTMLIKQSKSLPIPNIPTKQLGSFILQLSSKSYTNDIILNSKEDSVPFFTNILTMVTDDKNLSARAKTDLSQKLKLLISRNY